MRTSMGELGPRPVGSISAEYEATVRAGVERWAKVVKDAGIKSD